MKKTYFMEYLATLDIEIEGGRSNAEVTIRNGIEVAIELNNDRYTGRLLYAPHLPKYMSSQAMFNYRNKLFAEHQKYARWLGEYVKRKFAKQVSA